MKRILEERRQDAEDNTNGEKRRTGSERHADDQKREIGEGLCTAMSLRVFVHI